MKWVVLLLVLAQVGYGCFRSVQNDPPIAPLETEEKPVDMTPTAPLKTEEKASLVDMPSSSSGGSITEGLSSEPPTADWNIGEGAKSLNLKDPVVATVFEAMSGALRDTAQQMDEDLAQPESFKSRRPKMMPPVCSVTATDGSLVYNESCPYDSMCWQYHPVTTADAEFRFCVPSIMALVYKEGPMNSVPEKYPCVTPLGELPITLPNNEIYKLSLCQDKLLDSLISQSCSMVNGTQVISNQECGFNETCTFSVNFPFGNIPINIQLSFCANSTGQPVFAPLMPSMPPMGPRPSMPPKWPPRHPGHRRGRKRFGWGSRSSSSEESDRGFWSSGEEEWPGEEWPGEEDVPFNGPGYPPAPPPPNGNEGNKPVFPVHPQPGFGNPLPEESPPAWPQPGPIPPEPQLNPFGQVNPQGGFVRPLGPQSPSYPSIPEASPQQPPQTWGNAPTFNRRNNWSFQSPPQPAQNGGQGGFFGVNGRSPGIPPQPAQNGGQGGFFGVNRRRFGSQPPSVFGQGFFNTGGGPGFPQTQPGRGGNRGFNPLTNGQRPQPRRMSGGMGRGRLNRGWGGYTDGDDTDQDDFDDDDVDDGYEGGDGYDVRGYDMDKGIGSSSNEWWPGAEDVPFNIPDFPPAPPPPNGNEGNRPVFPVPPQDIP